MKDKDLEVIYTVMYDIGYNDEEIDKILYDSNLVFIKENILLKKINCIYNLLISLGYSRADVIKMTKTLPSLYSLSIENIKQKIEDLISLGYSQEDVIKMTKLLPALYSYSIENIKQKIEDLISLGYSQEDVIKMIKLLPALYSYSIENIKQKITFLGERQLDFIVIEDTKKLMQSIDLTYARYMFFKDKGIEVTRDNYQRLFYSAKIFEKQYGIDKSSLLEKYNYQEYLNSKKSANII